MGSVHNKTKIKKIVKHLKPLQGEGRRRAQGLKPRSGTLDSSCQLVHDSILNTTAGGLQTPGLQPPGCEMTSPLVYRQLTRGRRKQRDSGNWRWNWLAYRLRKKIKNKKNSSQRQRERMCQKNKNKKTQNSKIEQQMFSARPGP